MVEAILYILICVLTGLCGRDTRIGLLGTFIIAVVLTPLLLLPVLMLMGSPRRNDPSRHRIWRV